LYCSCRRRRRYSCCRRRRVAAAADALLLLLLPPPPPLLLLLLLLLPPRWRCCRGCWCCGSATCSCWRAFFSACTAVFLPQAREERQQVVAARFAQKGGNKRRVTLSDMWAKAKRTT
jgi:hypothetical protein